MVSDICPSGGIGIRARLKIVSRKGCGFDSHLGHRNKKLGLISSFLFCLFPTCRTCGNFIPPLLYLLISKYFL